MRLDINGCVRLSLASLIVLWVSLVSAAAADRARLEEFLHATGFDVALESLRLAAGSAPQMLGQEAEDFGVAWTRVADEVFAVEKLHAQALEILSATLSDDLLDHATAFYSSDLGQRLVEAENTSHMIENEDAKTAHGEALVAALVDSGSDRLALIQRMNDAIGGVETSVSAVQEIQVRFLSAASAAGIIELQMTPDDLHDLLRQQAPELRRAIQRAALSGAAFTYRDFSDHDLRAYAEALEHADMQQVYVLMTAVQFEIMAGRFETLAHRMAELSPEADL